MAKVLKVQVKGMITIPVEYRRKLGIEPETLLKMELKGDKLVLEKMQQGLQDIEIYSNEQIEKWLKEDKLDQETVFKVTKLLKS